MKNIFIIVFISLLAVGDGLAQATMSLQDAIDYAKQNNPEVVNAKLALNDADAQIEERRAIGLPKVDGTLEFNHYPQVPQQALPDVFAQAFGLPPDATNKVSFLLRNNFTAGINASSLIFDGTYLTALKAARLLKEYTQLQLNAKEMEVQNRVMDAYLPSLLIIESGKTLTKNIANLEQILFETKEIYKAGFAEQLDVDRLELSLANLVTEKEALVQQKDIAINTLKFVLAFPMNQELILEDDIATLLVESNDRKLTDEINYQNRPEYKVAETGLQLGELNIEQYERGYWPNLAAFGGYQYQYQGDNFSNGFWAPTFVLGARVNVPIFDGFQKRAQKDRATIALKQDINRTNILKSLITLEVENARKQYLLAKDKLANQEKNLALAEKIHKTTQIKYKEGVGSSLEVSQSEQSLYQTQQNRIQSMFDLLRAKVALDQALGY